MWDGNFRNKLPVAEYPALLLSRQRTAWKNRQYGLIEAGVKVIFETSGDPLYGLDGEFVGGVVWVRSLGAYDEVVARDLEATLPDFKAICNKLPHILWTTDPEGRVEFFSQSWYEFTGLTEAQSLGHEYTHAIHPNDMKQMWTKLREATGATEEMQCECRYRNRNGYWIWMVIRAKPAVGDDDQILKWYGSSTDVHENILRRLETQRTKSQVVEMLAYAEVALYRVSSAWQLSRMEGNTWLAYDEGNPERASNMSVRMQQLQEDGAPRLCAAARQIMSGEISATVLEQELESKWYRCRLLRDVDESCDPPSVRVLACLIDLTEHRQRAAPEAENVRLTAERTLEMEKSNL
jgi:PAS domain S-box-containing protein